MGGGQQVKQPAQLSLGQEIGSINNSAWGMASLQANDQPFYSQINQQQEASNLNAYGGAYFNNIQPWATRATSGLSASNAANVDNYSWQINQGIIGGNQAYNNLLANAGQNLPGEQQGALSFYNREAGLSMPRQMGVYNPIGGESLGVYNPVASQNYNPISGTNLNLSQYNPSTLNALTQNANSQLALGGAMSDQERQMASQQAQADYASRGIFNSGQAISADLLNLDSLQQARLQQREQNAQAVNQLQTSAYGAQTGAEIGGYQAQTGAQIGAYNARTGAQIGGYNAATGAYNALTGAQIGAYNAQTGATQANTNIAALQSQNLQNAATGYANLYGQNVSQLANIGNELQAADMNYIPNAQSMIPNFTGAYNGAYGGPSIVQGLLGTANDIAQTNQQGQFAANAANAQMANAQSQAYLSGGVALAGTAATIGTAIAL